MSNILCRAVDHGRSLVDENPKTAATLTLIVCTTLGLLLTTFAIPGTRGTMHHLWRTIGNAYQHSGALGIGLRLSTTAVGGIALGILLLRYWQCAKEPKARENLSPETVAELELNASENLSPETAAELAKIEAELKADLQAAGFVFKDQTEVVSLKAHLKAEDSPPRDPSET